MQFGSLVSPKSSTWKPIEKNVRRTLLTKHVVYCIVSPSCSRECEVVAWQNGHKDVCSLDCDLDVDEFDDEDITYETIFKSDERFGTICLILLMPNCQGETWGCIPAAPDGKDSLRNSIMSKLENKKVNVSELADFFEKHNFGRFTRTCNLLRVSLQSSITTCGRCSEWKMDCDIDLLPHECAYLVQHRDHFAGLCLDGASRNRAIEYILKVCLEEKMTEKYRKGIKIGE
eukprot:scaffold912_cov153-Amphora_coffeaeformis.AAC.2